MKTADFDILEDGAARPIAQFSESRVPVSTAIVLDVSGSISTEPNRWELTRRAVASFMSRLEGNDEVALFRALWTAAPVLREAAHSRKVLLLISAGREPVNRAMLGDLSEPTGGYFEVVSDPTILEAAVGRVADDLRDQYTLAFEPTKTDGEFHKIEVKTRAADHRVRARSGYVATERGR